MDFQRWLDLIRQSGGDPANVPLAWLENEYKSGISPAVVAQKLQGFHQAARMNAGVPAPSAPYHGNSPPADPLARSFLGGFGGVMGGCLAICVAVFVLCGGCTSMCNNAAANANQQREQQKKEEAQAKPKTASEIEADRKKAEFEAWVKKEETFRGPRPIPSSWDGITPEANAYLKANLRDYETMTLVECSDTVTYGTNAWAQRVKYRAKNGFGGTNLQNQLFVIRNGEVIDVQNF